MARSFFVICSVCIALLGTTSAAGEPVTTFTRAEIRALPPKEMAASILQGVAQTSVSSEEIKYYISPVAPTPPWLERVRLEMPSYSEKNFHVCRIDQLWVTFKPVDEAEANKHILDQQTYDPPTEIRNLYTEHLYANAGSGDSSDAACRAIPKTDYFFAQNDPDAEEALRAFRLFRDGMVSNGPGITFSCRTEAPHLDKDCEGSEKWLRHIASFSRVLSATNNKNFKRVMALEVSGPIQGLVYELRLTTSFADGHETLTNAELIVWHPPVI